MHFGSKRHHSGDAKIIEILFSQTIDFRSMLLRQRYAIAFVWLLKASLICLPCCTITVVHIRHLQMTHVNDLCFSMYHNIYFLSIKVILDLIEFISIRIIDQFLIRIVDILLGPCHISVFFLVFMQRWMDSSFQYLILCNLFPHT